MSSINSGTAGGTLAEQAQALKNVLASPEKPRVTDPRGEGTLRQFGTKFVKLKALSSDSEERELLVGEIVDEVRSWVMDCVESLVGAWDAIKKTEEDGEARAVLQKRTFTLRQEFEKLLTGDGIDGIEALTPGDRALVGRVAAIYYAAHVWNASMNGGIPAEETARALCFLLKAGAARITRDEPQGVKSIRVFSSMWIAFPYASSGRETPDLRAMEKSRLLSFAKAIARYARSDADVFGKSRESILKESTLVVFHPRSIKEFLEKPRTGKMALRVFPEYREKTKQYRSGGMALVAVCGDDENGYSLRVLNVFDDHLLASLLDAAGKNKEAHLLPEVLSLSSFLRNALPEGVCLSAIEIPMDLFKIADLRSWRVNVERCEDGVFRALCALTHVIRGTFLRAMKYEPKQTQKESAKPADTAQESGNRSNEAHGGKGEAAEDLKAALVRESEKRRLPICTMAEFLSPKRPRGVTLAEAPEIFWEGKEVVFAEIACVLARRKDGARAEILAFPPRLAELFNGTHNGLIFRELIKHAKQMTKESAPKEEPPDERETVSEPVAPAPLVPEVPEEEAHTQPEANSSNVSEETVPVVVNESPDAAPIPAEVNVWASPQARALAEELGIAYEKITPRGKKKVTKADVLAYAEKVTAS